MRDGLLLFVLGLMGFAGFLVWRHNGNPFPAGFTASPQTEAQPAPPSAPPPKHVVRKTAPAPEPATVAPVAAAEVVSAPPAPPEPSVEHREPPPFPGVSEIANGQPGDSVTTKFGDPALSALTSNNGRILGTYVYARDKGREATVIQLEDGKVATAYSKTVQPPARGLSIPRQKRAE